MEIKRLELFCRIVELKSFTRAAEAVRLSQPSVSEHIRLLENALGEKLLDRLGREVLPTPAGEVFLRYARRIIQLRDEALQAMAAFRGELTGQVLLGASSIPGSHVLPQLLETFRRQHPAIQVKMRMSGSGTILEELLEGALELAVVGAVKRDSRLEFEAIFHDRLVLVVPARHPWAGRAAVRAEELLDEPFLVREAGSGSRTVAYEALRGIGFDPERLTVVAEMGSNEAVRQGVKVGLGVSILSACSVAEDLDRGLVATPRIEGLTMNREFWLATRRSRQMSPLALAFRGHLLAHRDVDAVPGGAPQ